MDRELRELETKSAEVKAQAEADWDKYGANLDEILELKKKVAEEPCDRVKTRKLTKLLYQSGVFREVISTSETFWEKCGDFPRLRWTTYESHKSLSEWDEAIADASKLIEENPYDKDFWWWRGIAYEKKGDFEKAAENYEQAISLVPELRSIPFNLANMYEKLDRPCDAIWPLEQFLHFHPNVRNAEKITRRINGLYGHDKCKDLIQRRGKSVSVRIDPSGVLVTKATINGVKGTFIIDSGASFVALDSTFADKAGISSRGRVIRLETANGPALGRIVRIDAVKLKSIEAKRVPAVVLEGLDGVDGLLGMSFLSRFNLTFKSDVIVISPN